MTLVGRPAPAIDGTDQYGAPFALPAGRPALVVFFPWAFSGICGGEIVALRDAHFPARGIDVVGVTCDAMFTLRVWSDQQGLDFPLVSDHWRHGAISRSYGVFDEEAGVALRGTFLVGADGVVAWSVVRGIGDVRTIEEYDAAIAALR